MACRHTIFHVTEHISKTGKGSTVDGRVIVWSSVTKKYILLHFVHPDTPKVGTLYKTETEQGIFDVYSIENSTRRINLMFYLINFLNKGEDHVCPNFFGYMTKKPWDLEPKSF